ncbi:MAG: 5'/3'-nucleotidase SurE, partial [Prevotella sp.]|nr:5'/3'-nucleotidase SurE [Prevotella sp.]
MNQHRPFILISNDDGYDSNGIRILVDMIKDIADILVCAPDSGRSGFSCAFSATKYLVLNRQENIDDVEVWSCNGTPVDCVKLAIDQLCDGRKPDLVIGGINHGDNSTVNNHYSGTVGVALEGCLKYIPSIA